MLKYLIKFFILSIIIVASLVFFMTGGKEEANVEAIIYIAIVASSFNIILIAITEIQKITNLKNTSIFFSLVEVSVYFFLVYMTERIIKWGHFSVKDNVLLDFPFTYMYPTVLLFMIFYFLKRLKQRNRNTF